MKSRRSWDVYVAVVFATVTLAGCAPDGHTTIDPFGSASGSRSGPEAISLLGRALTPMDLSDDVRAARESNLVAAQAAVEADPNDEGAIIWYGRRLAYLGRYRDAIDVFTDGLRRHPGSSKLLRHRGHRYLTVRRIDDAIADLSTAAGLIVGVPDTVEADGLPNRLDIPTSTSHTNIYYHLGLGQYVQGRYAEALGSYRACLSFAKNDDMRCATLYWLYLTLRRLGLDAEARAQLADVTPDMDIIENTSYHQLLLLFKGAITVDEVTGGPSAVGAAIDDATTAYGIAMWHMLQGNEQRARGAFARIVEGKAWPAFGHLAAEAELTRVR